MTRLLKIWVAVLLGAMLAACGGGGGSAGSTATSGTGGSTGGTTPTVPVVTLELRDAADKTVTQVSSAAVVYARATVKTAAGVAVANQVVTFSGDTSLIKFLPLSGTALTDASGVAIVQVQPASTSAAGAGTLAANATVSGVVATAGSYNFSVPVAGGNSSVPTISLGLRDAANAATTVVDASGNTLARAVLLDTSGAPIANALVAFSDASGLLRFSPASGAVLTNASGLATVQVSPASAASAGAGTLSVSATVSGTAISRTFDYQVAAVSSAGVPTLTLGLRDASGASTNSVGAAGITTARAIVRDASGAVVAGKLVTISGDATKVKFNPASGQVLTDSSGVASVQVTPASLSASGASTLVAATTVAGSSLSTSFDYQLAVANLSLQSLNVGSGAMAAYGNRAISVVAAVNGTAATSTPIQVTFSASCGTVNPASVTTDSAGMAATTYKADSPSCAGSNVTVSASAVGASSLSGTIAVSASQATNIQFIEASPQLIYLTGSVGATQSNVSFKVVDSGGNPLQNQQVRLSLVNSAPGVTLNAVGNTSPVTLSTDATGLVSVAVFSGTVPTSVQVRAVLVSNTAVTATSNVLVVASGRPVQRAISLALNKLSIEGFNIDGVTARATISLADRQGNPVPDGTQVNFTTNYGVMIPASCTVAGGTSSCSVDIRSQGERSLPFKGRVAILAYVPGEEDFIDLNGNNVYDAGEPFADLGNAYRDEYTSTISGVSGLSDGAFTVGEFIVPRTGSVSCKGLDGLTNNGGVNGRDGTCDGVWGTVDVRAQAMIQFATSTAAITIGNLTGGGFSALVVDLNGNSMPTGSTLSAVKTSGSDSCAVSAPTPSVVPSTYQPTLAVVAATKCIANDRITFSVTTPSGMVTSTTVTLP